MIDFFATAVRDLRQAHAPLPASRECEQCPRTAWLLETETRDGRQIEHFVCAAGHLKILTTIVPEAPCS